MVNVLPYQIQQKREDLKVIVASATLDAEVIICLFILLINLNSLEHTFEIKTHSSKILLSSLKNHGVLTDLLCLNIDFKILDNTPCQVIDFQETICTF